MPVDDAAFSVLRAARVHCIGIGGTGMRAIAELLLARGQVVSGSDVSASEALAGLERAGATVHVGHAAHHVNGAEAVVTSAAIPSDNPELVAAREGHLPVATHAQVLGALSTQLTTIAVAGTYGKSTTAAMTAHVLVQSGRDPTCLGGAYSADLEGSARLGRSDLLVVEADEYARRFLSLTPSAAIVTGVEPDHLDYYGDSATMEAAFCEFVGCLKPGGSLVVCIDSPLPECVAGAQGKITYGFGDNADWRLSDYAPSEHGVQFTLHPPTTAHIGCQLQVPGRHNALNAVASIAASTLVGVPVDVAVAALSRFHGVARRFETVYRKNGIWLVDDYAHHPAKLRATLRAAREIHPGRIWAVFQPHTTHRTASLLGEFAQSFGDADEVVLLPIYEPEGREVKRQPVSSTDLANAMTHPSVRNLESFDEAAERLAEWLRPGDLALTLGAGSVTVLGPQLAELLDHRG